MTIKKRKFSSGIRLKGTTDVAAVDGEIRNDSAVKRTKVYHDTDGVDAAAEHEILTADQTQTVTNKTIDATDATGTGSISTDASDASYDDANVTTNPIGGTPLKSLGDDVQAALDSVKVALDDQNNAEEIAYTQGANTKVVGADVQAALDAADAEIVINASAASTVAGDLATHIGDATDAHDSSAVTYTPGANTIITAIEVQAALDDAEAELVSQATDIGTNATSISDHIADAADAHDASAVSYVNTTSGLVSSDAQAAIDEVDGNLDTHEAATATHGVSGAIVGTTDTQDLSNKTFIGPVANSIQTASGAGSVSITLTAPVVELSAGITKVFGLSFSGNQECKIINRSGGTVTVSNQDVANVVANTRIITGTAADIELKNDAALFLQYSTNDARWNVIGGSGTAEAGSGGINYLTGDDTNFEAGVGTWVGDTNISVIRTTVNPTRGTASGILRKAAVNALNQTMSVPFTIDNADLAQKLTISLDKKTFNDYADGDLVVEVIQDPAGTPITIPVNGEDIQAGTGVHYAQFQTDHTEKDYALSIRVNTTDAPAFDVQIDNVIVGPTNLAFGAIVTDWESYTPTLHNFGNGTVTAQYRRVGDTMEITAKLVVGSIVPTGYYDFTIPSGHTIDTTKIASAAQGLGIVQYYNTGSGAQFIGSPYIAATNNRIGFLDANGGYIWNNLTPQTVPASAAIMSVTMQLPIQGWSSNAQMSEDLGGREIIAKGAGNGGGSVTANVTNIDFTETKDTTASFDGTTFTAPETGEYLIKGNVATTVATSGNIRAYINTVADIYIGPNQTSNVSKIFNGQISLTRGDSLTLRCSATVTLNNVADAHYISISKLASPQTILETATVAARYTSNSGQSVAANAAITYEDKVFDTHNAMSGDTYTIPASGIYTVGSTARANTSVGYLVMHLNVNGTDKHLAYVDSAGINDTGVVSLNTVFEFTKGDAVVISASFGGATATLHTDAASNVFSIARIK